MPISVNASAALSGAGSFATSRRGAVGYDEIAQARAALGSRATAAQVAKMIGRCEADVRPLMACRSEVEAAQVLVTLRPVAPDGHAQAATVRAACTSLVWARDNLGRLEKARRDRRLAA